MVFGRTVVSTLLQYSQQSQMIGSICSTVRNKYIIVAIDILRSLKDVYKNRKMLLLLEYIQSDSVNVVQREC